MIRRSFFLSFVTALLACSSDDASSPLVKDDAGADAADTAFPVEHEPACDPGPTPLAEHSIGPSTRVATLVSKNTPLATAGRDNPSAHDGMTKYLADGMGDFAKGPGRDGGVVDDLLPGSGASAGVAGRKSVAYIHHTSDFQLADDESPVRLIAFDNSIAPGAGRPQEGALPLAVSAMHRTITALTKSRPLDFEIVTGDCADNSQKNEHEWFLGLMNGQKGLTTDSGDDDDPVLGPGNDVKDPFDAVAAPAPWYFVFGNHDVEIQGTSNSDEGTVVSALGDEPKNGTRDYRLMYAPITRELVPADAKRMPVSRAEIIAGLLADGAAPGPKGHGFTSGALTHYVTEPIPGVPLRLIQLDTNDPDAGSDGQVTQKTLDEFLEPALVAAEKDGKLVILASHHATTNIDPGKGLESTPVPGALTGKQVEDAVAKHPNVILWLVGHNHHNRV
ncbi:MAG: metallophosphoesterase, partial [Polyangiales bacterium]